MRRAISPLTCLAVLTAYFLAPFQHVHADPEHGSFVHAHFYGMVHADPPGVHFDDADDHTLARPLDTFTPGLVASLAPFILPLVHVVQADNSARPAPVTGVEACAHDPPSADRSNPRAPPV